MSTVITLNLLLYYLSNEKLTSLMVRVAIFIMNFKIGDEKIAMKNLNKKLLMSPFAFPTDLAVQAFPSHLPERVIQFGEGNFLRAFVDWMFHQLNKQGLFNGRVVALSPRGGGAKTIAKLNEQDGLYTVLLRGLQDGKLTEQQEIISSVSRGINPYTDWQAYLKCAENPDIEFVVSNTTEAGITYNSTDRADMEPPASFPGKLTIYLYHRFQYFNGEPSKGMVILPCELIHRNGDKLKSIILQFADDWNLSPAFKLWVNNHNYFLNTLVDRVVTGYPQDEIDNVKARLGYNDDLLIAGEIFYLFVIEGPETLAKRLPFNEVGLNVIWTNDMAPYLTRKVRILNGAHSASVPAAFLCGLETVGEMMDHEAMGRYVREIIRDEIIPSIDLDKGMLNEFADAVIERFKNPFIHHQLLSILLNSSSKFKVRIVPSILEYQQLNGKLPDKLTFSLATLIAVYKDGKVVGTSMQARRDKGEFVMHDDVCVLEFFAKVWCQADVSRDGLLAVVKTVLENAEIWGQDLNQVQGLTEKTADYLYQIVTDGPQTTIARLLGDTICQH